jgi:hypothetical protein
VTLSVWIVRWQWHLGFEALSRYAGHVTMVEDESCCQPATDAKTDVTWQ